MCAHLMPMSMCLCVNVYFTDAFTCARLTLMNGNARPERRVYLWGPGLEQTGIYELVLEARVTSSSSRPEDQLSFAALPFRSRLRAGRGWGVGMGVGVGVGSGVQVAICSFIDLLRFYDGRRS